MTGAAAGVAESHLGASEFADKAAAWGALFFGVPLAVLVSLRFIAETLMEPSATEDTKQESKHG